MCAPCWSKRFEEMASAASFNCGERRKSSKAASRFIGAQRDFHRASPVRAAPHRGSARASFELRENFVGELFVTRTL